MHVVMCGLSTSSQRVEQASCQVLDVKVNQIELSTSGGEQLPESGSKEIYLLMKMSKEEK